MYTNYFMDMSVCASVRAMDNRTYTVQHSTHKALHNYGEFETIPIAGLVFMLPRNFRK